MLNVVVTMMIKEGHMQDFLAVCADVRPRVLKEKGCQGYDYYRDAPWPQAAGKPAEPNRLTLLERWESATDLQAHLETPHMKDFASRVKDLRASVEVRVVEPVVP
jgi:quinol monooxygenase YgiN